MFVHGLSYACISASIIPTWRKKPNYGVEDQENVAFFPILSSLMTPLCPCFPPTSSLPARPPLPSVLSLCRPPAPLSLMLWMKLLHCQPNDCLDCSTRQPVCLLHHWNMDSVSAV